MRKPHHEFDHNSKSEVVVVIIAVVVIVVIVVVYYPMGAHVQHSVLVPAIVSQLVVVWWYGGRWKGRGRVEYSGY